jgi:ligand-binding sensor domain-containing protein/signal transduction histidine kinase
MAKHYRKYSPRPVGYLSTLLLLFTICPSLLFAQHDKASLPKPRTVIMPKGVAAKDPIANFTNFGTEQGLALSAVTCGYADKNGNLWFGTPGGGVSQYDGKSFVTYNASHGLAHNNIRSITEDHSGNFWFGTAGGASRYDGKSFTTISTNDGLVNNWVRTTFVDKNGNIWMGTDEGVSKYDGKSFVNFTTDQGLVNNRIVTIIEDSKGFFWFGSSRGGVSRFDGKNFTNYTTENGLLHNNVFSIAEDKDGIIWIGTDGGLNLYDGKKIKPAPWLTSTRIRIIKKDSNGNIWFGTNAGASCYDGKHLTTFDTDNGLAHNTIMAIVEDKKGNIWLGTNGGGLSRYEGKSITAYTTRQGLAHNTVWSITEDKSGNLWMGTERGVNLFDGQTFSNFTTDDGLAHNTVYAITQDRDGSMWFGTEGGATRYDKKTFTTFTSANGLGNNSAAAITQDKNGNLWFGSYVGGVTKYDGKSFQVFNTENGLPDNRVLKITEDNNGDIWLATGNGVSRYDGKSFTNYSTQHGLAHFDTKNIFKDRNGNLWIGTDGGVSRFDGKTFITYNARHGLPDDVVYDLVEDESGVLWIGTNLGFSGLSFKNKKGDVTPGAAITVSNAILTEDYLPIWEVYNNKTGFPIKDLNSNAMCFTKIGFPNGDNDDKGVIWAGCGDDKLIRFALQKLDKSKEPPVVVIKNIKVNEEPVNWYGITVGDNRFDSTTVVQQEMITYGKGLSKGEKETIENKFSGIGFTDISAFYPVPQNLLLPYANNHITFEFNAIETGRNLTVKYQYMLEGQDDAWSPVTKKDEATFDNLWEGNYTFKLKAQSREGIWSEPLALVFTVQPPWWRTWWMYGTYVLLFSGSFMLIIKWREQKLERQNEKLERTVQQRTLEVVHQKEEAERQKELVEEKSQAISYQNEELKLQQEEIASQRDFIETKNTELSRAYSLIEEKNMGLEKTVDERTKDLQSAYDQLVKAHKELDMFVYRSSHDLKGPIASILGLCNLGIAEPLLEGERATDYFNKVQFTALKLKDTLDRLIRTQELKNNPLHIQPLHFKKLFDNVIQDIDHDLKENAVLKINGDVVINSDESLLFILLRNLIVNGLQYRHKKASTEEVKVDCSLINDKFINIKVKNSGTGIPEESVPHIFNMFYKANDQSQGAGLGLYEAKIIAEKLKGEIKLLNYSAEETTFEVNLSNTF